MPIAGEEFWAHSPLMDWLLAPCEDSLCHQLETPDLAARVLGLSPSAFKFSNGNK